MLLLLFTYTTAVYFIAKAWYKLYVVSFGIASKYAMENGEISLFSFSQLDEWDMQMMKSLFGKILLTNLITVLVVFFITSLYQMYF